MDVLRLTLRQLQIFTEVAASGSTSAASGALALSQSATSSAINELERTLGLQLFDRAGRRLLLNDNGRTLLPRAHALLDGAAAVERMARDSDAQREALRIGASTTIAHHMLPGLLADFLGQRPRERATWRSRVAIDNTAVVCARVAAFELDIGLIEGPCHEPALRVEPWLTDELVVVTAPAGAAVRGKARMGLRELRESVWLLRELGSGTRETTDQLLLPHLRAWRRSIELGSSMAIMNCAAAGLGVACLSRWLVDEMIAASCLAEVDTTLPRFIRRYHWVVHRDKGMTPALAGFISLLERAGAHAPAVGAARRS